MRAINLRDEEVRVLAQGDADAVVEVIRPMAPQPELVPPRYYIGQGHRWIFQRGVRHSAKVTWGQHDAAPSSILEAYSPLGKVGEKLWLREAWKVKREGDRWIIVYRADESEKEAPGIAEAFVTKTYQPSTRMSRWATRGVVEVLESAAFRQEEQWFWRVKLRAGWFLANII